MGEERQNSTWLGITFLLTLNLFFWLKGDFLEVLAHFSQVWTLDIMSVIEPGFRPQYTFILKVFISPQNVCCCGYESICSAACFWLVSKLQNSRAVYWKRSRGSADAQPAPVFSDGLTEPDHHLMLEEELARTNQCGGRKDHFYLPYLAVMRELGTNILRHPLYGRIHFYLTLRNELLRWGSTICGTEPALGRAELIELTPVASLGK